MAHLKDDLVLAQKGMKLRGISKVSVKISSL